MASLESPARALGGQTRNRLVLALFCALAFAVRLPIMHLNLIDWDESTFLVMAQHVADGGLPYLGGAWDNKPPLLFWLMAPLSALAHGDITLIRIAAALLDIFAAWLAKRLADRMFGEKLSHWLVAVACYGVSTRAPVGGMLATYSFAIPMLLGALLLLAGKRSTRRRFLIAGALLGAAALCRLNFALPAVALGVLQLVQAAVRRDSERAIRAVCFAIGGLTTLALAMAPYAATGNIETFVQSVFLAPLTYVGDRTAAMPIVQLLEVLSHERYLIGLIVFAIAGVALNFNAVRAAPFAAELAVFSAALLLCISIGPVFSHYLTAIIAFVAVWAAPGFAGLINRAQRYGLHIVVAGAVLLVMSFFPVKKMIGEPKADDEPSARVYAIVTTDRRPGDSYYFAVDHINNWRLHIKPLSPIVTHPDNLFLPYFYRAAGLADATPASVIADIVSRQPTWIVLPQNTKGYWSGTPVSAILQPALTAHYDRVAAFSERAIYKRKSPP